MGDYTHYTWSTTGSGFDGDCEIWYGGTLEVGICDPATTPWQELYHEGDYQGIADQLKAEEMGLA